MVRTKRAATSSTEDEAVVKKLKVDEDKSMNSDDEDNSMHADDGEECKDKSLMTDADDEEHYELAMEEFEDKKRDVLIKFDAIKAFLVENKDVIKTARHEEDVVRFIGHKKLNDILLGGMYKNDEEGEFNMSEHSETLFWEYVMNLLLRDDLKKPFQFQV